jgi:hypothetical protein
VSRGVIGLAFSADEVELQRPATLERLPSARRSSP